MSVGLRVWNGRTTLAGQLRTMWKEAVVAYCKKNCVKI